MRGLGRKLVAIQTEARCLKSNTCRLPPRGTTAADLASVMLLLDGSTIAKNVGRRLLFEGSRRAARSHSDLGGCADGTTSAAESKTLFLARVCLGLDCHEFSSRPRIHKHANAWWSMHLHTILLDTSKAQLACMACTCAEALPLDMSKALTDQW